MPPAHRSILHRTKGLMISLIKTVNNTCNSNLKEMMFKLLDEKHLTDNPSDIFRGVSQSLVKIYIVTLDWKGGGFLKMFIIPISLSNLL